MKYTEKTWFAKQIRNTQLCNKLSHIRLVITDVDGCITPGQRIQLDIPTTGKYFSFYDGFIIKHAQKSGLHVAILSGDHSKSTKIHAQRLGIPEPLCRIVPYQDKLATAQEIQAYVSITPAETLAFGDDVQDIALAETTTLLAAPANALFYVRDSVDIISPRNSGDGALRLLLDLILFVQQNHPYQDIIATSLKE